MQLLNRLLALWFGGEDGLQCGHNGRAFCTSLMTNISNDKTNSIGLSVQSISFGIFGHLGPKVGDANVNLSTSMARVILHPMDKFCRLDNLRVLNFTQ